MLTVEGCELWEKRLKLFMYGKSAIDGKVVMSLKAKLQANITHMKALGNALQAGCGFGLAKFAPKRPIGFVQPPLQRFWVNLESLPAPVREASPGRSRRSCIVNSATHERWWEVAWSGERAVLQSYCDQGNTSWPAKHILFVGLGLRGGVWRDPPHRRWNVLKAWEQAKLNLIKNEFAIVANLLIGPWSGAAFFHEVREAAAEYFNNRDEHDSLFVLMYERIVTDMVRSPRASGRRNT